MAISTIIINSAAAKAVVAVTALDVGAIEEMKIIIKINEIEPSNCTSNWPNLCKVNFVYILLVIIPAWE